MAFEMTAAQPTVTPFAPAAHMPQPKPAFGPLAAAPAMTKPTATTAMPGYFRTMGNVVGGIHRDSKPEIETMQRSGVQPQGAWHPTALQEAVKDPVGTIERRSGRSVEDIFADMQKNSKEEIPDDLTKQEKGMLLMQLGFGIMAGGPGLATALGQSGMAMMGSWHDLRRDKRREGRQDRSDKQELLGAELRVAAGREASEARAATEVAKAQAAANKPLVVKGSLVTPTGEVLYEAPAAPSKPSKPDVFGSPQTGYWALGPDGKPQNLVPASAGGKSGGKPQIFGSAETGYYQLNADGSKTQLLEGTGAQSPTGLYQELFQKLISLTYGDAEEAHAQAIEATRRIYPDFELPSATGARTQQVEGQSVMPSQSATAAIPSQETASFTAPMPPLPVPAVGTIDEGMRFKGGNPSKPENWEPAS